MATLTLVLLAVVVLVGIVAVIGGVSMMINNDGCFWSWWMGYNAMKAGFVVLEAFLPALVEAAGELLSAIFSNR